MSRKPDREAVDHENPEWTRADFARAESVDQLSRELRAVIERSLPKTRVGRPRMTDAKVVVTLRLRPSLVAAFRAQGADWRRRMEDTLTSAAARGSVGRQRKDPA
jgi:uncharacterized protein (DUF4415 family)